MAFCIAGMYSERFDSMLSEECLEGATLVGGLKSRLSGRGLRNDNI